MSTYSLFGDGSAQVGGPASCACIVDDYAGETVAKLCALLPETTPLEAETMGGVLGLSFLIAEASGGVGRLEVKWHCDSLAVIDRVNRSSDRVPFDLTAMHVLAHSGHVRNEACDRACRWIRLRGARMIERHGEGAVGLGKGAMRWVLSDLRTVAFKANAWQDLLLRILPDN